MKTIIINYKAYTYDALSELKEVFDENKISILGGAKLGDFIRISSLVKIEHEVEIGDNVIIESGVMIDRCAKIGDDIIIKSCTKIERYASIGSYVSIGLNAVIGRGSIIDDYVTIGGNVKIMNKAIINSNSNLQQNNCFYAENLYQYNCFGYIDNSGILQIKMGCYQRSEHEWDADFWNNDSEFPNDGSENSEARLRAYKTIKFFFDEFRKEKPLCTQK